MLFRLLRSVTRTFWPLALGVVVFQIGQTLAQLYIPTLNAHIIDRGVATGNTSYIWHTGALMLALSIAQAVLNILGVICAASLAMRTGRNLRARLFARVTDFSEKEISHFTPGSLITRCTNDVQNVQLMFSMASTAFISAPILCIGGIIMALNQRAGIGWIMAVSVPLLLIISVGIISRMVPLFRSYQNRLDAVNRIFHEQLTGIRVLRAFVREDTERARFSQANRDITSVSFKVGQLFVMIFPLVIVVLNITVVGVYWFGAFQIEAGTTNIGTLIAYMTYLMMILSGIIQMSFVSLLLPRSSVSAERIGEVLDTTTSISAPTSPKTQLSRRGEVEFKDVIYSYPGAQSPVISDFSLRVAPGTTLAILGATGSGKSTLIHMITRLIDATEGSVSVGGVDVRELDPEVLSATIGFVPQQSYLFAGTVRSNLLFGRKDASDEEMWEALRIAQAEDFVREMEGGLDAPISQGGTNVSGGQRQRLSIARAIIHQPDIFLFDDSFSALDTETEARLREGLAGHAPGASKIVVASRASTVREADHIIVVESGRIVGEGRHATLMETCPEYRDIVDSQLGVDASCR